MYADNTMPLYSYNDKYGMLGKSMVVCSIWYNIYLLWNLPIKSIKYDQLRSIDIDCDYCYQLQSIDDFFNSVQLNVINLNQF